MEEQVKLIHNEKNPFLREIWGLGYIKCYEDECINKIVLIHKEGYKKEISRLLLTENYKIKRGLMPDGTIHEWLSDRDGSCERFIQKINNAQKIN